MATNNAINAPLPLSVTQGGFNRSTLTNHGLLVGAGAAAVTQLASATDGQVPIGSVGADPVLATLVAGTNITIVNGPGSITVNATAGGGTDIEFLAYLSADQLNFMGDGVEYTIVCDTVIFSTGGGYNNGTGEFTAPQAGTYLFSAYVAMSNLGAGHTVGSTQLFSAGNPQLLGPVLNPFAASTTNSYEMGQTCIMELAMGEVVTFRVTVGTGLSSKTVTLSGNAGNVLNTRLSVKLLNPS